MMRSLLMVFALLIALAPQAQDARSVEDKEAAYTRAITSRSEKIVATLGISDTNKAKRVNGLLIQQYRNLNLIYTVRDEQVKLAKSAGTDKRVVDSLSKAYDEAAAARVQSLHAPFITALSKELTKEQVDKVKDGMTFNVLNVTYKAMQEMIPTLKPAEKAQILAWLTEARELAMDAESSEKKHWWFGKYKGRINNYLSAQGYDLQKERKEWEERIRTTKENTRSTQ